MDPSAFAMAIIGGVAAGTLLVPVAIARIIVKHREHMAQMRYRQEGSPGLVEEVAALRREVTQLRETTTKFDVSFDAAICRVEERVERLEGERRTATAAVQQPETETVVRRS